MRDDVAMMHARDPRSRDARCAMRDDDDDSAANDMVQVCVFGGDFIQGQQLHIYNKQSHISCVQLSEPRAASRLSMDDDGGATAEMRRGDNETATWSMVQGVFRGNFIQGQQCTST